MELIERMGHIVKSGVLVWDGLLWWRFGLGSWDGG